MTRLAKFIALVSLFGLGRVASAQWSCSNIDGATPTVSGGYQCVTTDPPFQQADTTWSITATCNERNCSTQSATVPYDYPSATLSGNGQCGKYDTSTQSQIPGATNCHAAIFGSSTSNNYGGENIYTVSEIDQTQSSNVQSCLNGNAASSEAQAICAYESCPVCGFDGYCSDNSGCESGLSCADGVCLTNDGGTCSDGTDCVSGCCTSGICGCGGGDGGGDCPDGNGCSCSTDLDCDSGNCVDGECEDLDPIIVDLTAHGYQLTNAAGGVTFDFYGDRKPILMSWTAAGWDGGFLALDRNGNGRIDNGTELFSNITPQPSVAGQGRNGFLALAVYDQPENGGNGDGWIDEQDAVYPKLLIWVDKNHNGISEPNELLTLKQAGIQAISLGYSQSQWTDAFGNVFRYSSHLRTNTSPNQVFYDVILQKAGSSKVAPTAATKQ